MVNAKIDYNSKVTLILKKQKLNGDTFVVGDEMNGTFIELPQEAIRIIDLCDGTRTIKEIQNILEIEMGEEYDVIEFVSDLYELNLVYKINGHIILKRNETSHLGITKFIAHLFFEKKMHIIYGIIIFINVCMICFTKDNWPNYKSAEIIAEHSGLSLICFTIIGIIITIFHEIGHYLSAVELHIPTKVKLSLRLFYLVVETDINSIWAIERNKRYICYFAGFYTENLILLLTLLIKKFELFGKFGEQICDAIILTIFLNFIWQFMIFLRTDFYFVILNYLNVPTLHFSAMQFLGDTGKCIKKTDKKVLIYLLIYVVGVISSVFYLINESLIYMDLFLQSIDRFTINFDNVCFGIMMILNIALWGTGAYNRYKDFRKEHRRDE